MGSFDWKGLVKSIAPMLGTALGGPLGGIAGAALGKALGTPDAEPASLAAAIQGATPDQLAAIQKADQDFKLQMATLGFKNVADMESLAAGDRANARDREIKTGDSWTPRILAAVVVIFWCALSWFVMRHVIPTESLPLAMRILGTLDAALMLVLAYYFGSSAGSARKDEIYGGQK